MPSPALSSDEGEIMENGAEDHKATSLPQPRRTGVDRPDRTRARNSRSPDSSYSSRRSRSPRGQKRPRHDRDYYAPAGRSGADARRFRVHYEDAPRNGRGRGAYEDLDRPPSGSSRYDDLDRPGASSSNYRYSDRDRDHERYSDKRARNRSPSPRGRGRDRGRRDRARRDGGRPGRQDHGRNDSFMYGDQAATSEDTKSKRATIAGDDGSIKHVKVAKSAQGPSDHQQPEYSSVPSSEVKESRAPGPQPQPEPDMEWEEPQPIDEDAEIERRRRRREEILAKSRATTPAIHALQVTDNHQSVSTPASTGFSSPRRTTDGNTPRSVIESPRSPGIGTQDGMSPGGMDIFKEDALVNTHAQSNAHEADGPSAADYDPTADMKEDERRDELRNGNVGLHGEALAEGAPKPTIEDEPQPPAKANLDDGDDEDDFDMFAEDLDEDKLKSLPTPRPASKSAAAPEDGAAPVTQAGGGMLEDDDKDGYYKIRPGEILGGRYHIQSALGKGMFSGVARAVDITTKKLVAIKIMRNNDALKKGGYVEIAILQKLNDADPENRKHIVKFERHFEYKGHLCLAFENLSLNLREVLKKFGNNIGINLNATRAYSYQIFLALSHLRKCSIIHADLKPDNILVNENRNMLKICDLGTAIDRSDAATSHNEITPYLVSRFYRAPEIILGTPYDYAVDMWSIGCTLYELYTGKILFTGDSNNQMLKAIMETRGKLSGKLYRRGELSHMHFDEMGNFVSVERDRALGKTNVRTLPMNKPTRDLRTRLMAASGGMDDAETRELNLFIDLLEKCLALNPDKRITPLEALKHPFFSHKLGGHASAR